MQAKGEKMKQTIGNYEFVKAFENMGRQDNFSQAGLDTLFEMLEEWEEEIGEELELDVIAICCQFTEYAIDELLNDYEFVKEYYSTDWEELDDNKKKELVEEALDSRGCYYRWIDDESLILDVESF